MTSTKLRKRKSDEISKLDKQLLKALDDTKLPKSEDDEHDLFAASLASQMRRIGNQNPIKLGRLKIKIQELLFEAEFSESL